jgi:hypothetical protein
VVARRGVSTLGCLIVILLLAAAIYFAFGFGAAYFRAYQFKDSIRSDAEFASTLTDAKISSHLAAVADSLELPPAAGDVTITRSQRSITISSDYDEVIKLPFKKEKVIHFHPTVDADL